MRGERLLTRKTLKCGIRALKHGLKRGAINMLSFLIYRNAQRYQEGVVI